MRQQDYILLIMNCEKYRYKADAQTTGWLKNINDNIIYYHVIGKETLATNFLFDDIARILYVKSGDDYNSLPHKVIMAYLAITMSFQYKYILKTDDDQVLTDACFFDRLICEIQTNKPDYGGLLITIEKDHISEYYHFHPELPRDVIVKATSYCNGRFYILSRCSVLNLLEKMNEFKKEFFEDYSIGYYLDPQYKTNFLHIRNDVFVDSI
jgi:hypothetical protein